VFKPNKTSWFEYSKRLRSSHPIPMHLAYKSENSGIVDEIEEPIEEPCTDPNFEAMQYLNGSCATCLIY
jgi:hypothetical protein